jgi:hypothetical protein
MSRLRFLVASIFLGAPAFVAPRIAHAVHKSWVIRNDGSQCAFSTPDPALDSYWAYSLQNVASFTRTVGCPFALSARWGSTTPSVALPLWAGAWAANIYVNNGTPGTALTCTTRARLASGITRYSRSVSTTSGGEQRLTTALAGDWGDTLEASEAENVRYMDFDCSLPASSTVYGHKVRICQRLGGGSDCGLTGDRANGEDTTRSASGTDYVQTSGMECTTFNNNEVSRGHTGLVNSNVGYSSVSCPLTLPADDTNEAIGSMHVMVHYKTTVSNEYPTCWLNWRDRHGRFDGTAEDKWSLEFQRPISSGYVYLNNIETRLPVGTGVFCFVPPGMTIQGITAQVGVAEVSGGG